MATPRTDFLQPFEQIEQIMQQEQRPSGGQRIQVISDPDEVQAVMHSRSMLRSETMRSLAGDGLIFSDGAKWKSRNLAPVSYYTHGQPG